MRIYLIVFILFIYILPSCKKEATTWNIQAKGPIFNTSLSLDNILADSILDIQFDNRLHLNYVYHFKPINTSEVFAIPDTIIEKKYNLPVPNPVTLNPGFAFVNDPQQTTFNYGDTRILEMKVKSGKIEYRIESQINEKTLYTYKILRTNDGNGNAFEKSIIVPAGTPLNPGISQGSFDLSGYHLDMRGPSSLSYNTLETELKVLVNPSGNAVSVSKFDSIIIKNSIIDLTPEYIKGYLGQSVFEENGGSTNFDVLKKIVDGSLDIDDVDIQLNITNYVGADARFTLQNFTSFNDRTSSSINLNHAIINNAININRATLNGESTITPTTKSYSLTKSNSNIDFFIENLPNQLQYGFEAEFNPLGNISGYNDFLFVDKTIDLDFNINMPLSLIATNLTLVDTLDLKIDSLNAIQDGSLELLATNSFPFDADVQLYVLDAQLNIADSLFTTTLAPSAMLDVSNIVIQPTNTTLKAFVSSSKMNFIKNNPKVIVKVRYNTRGTGHVDLYSYQKMDLKLIGDLNYLLKVK